MPKVKSKYMLLEEVEVGGKFIALKYTLTKTGKTGVDYRIVCVDEKGNEHNLKRSTPVCLLDKK